MGTSASHSGPKSGVSFDPPWLDDLDGPEMPEAPSQNPQETPNVPSLALPARFGSARRNLGDYIKSGNRDSLKKALGHYAHTGMGGSRNVANRMRHSANIASKLFTSFRSLREGNEPTISSIILNYRTENIDVYAMIDAIAQHICGDGGSLDETSPVNSVSSALSDLFETNPDIDIMALSDDAIWSLVSSFLSYEAFSRIQLDIGQRFETKDIPLSDLMIRLHDMRDYLEAEISSQVMSIRQEFRNTSPLDLRNYMLTAIERTFKVFEVTV